MRSQFTIRQLKAKTKRRNKASNEFFFVCIAIQSNALLKTIPRRNRLRKSFSCRNGIIMPKTRDSVATELPLKSLETAAIQVGKRRSPCESDSDQLVKKLKLELNLSGNKKSRKLKNITNTADQSVLAGEELVESKKRKLSRDNGALPQTANPAREEAALIAEAQGKLKDVLGKHYFDAGNRLNLDYVPSCLRNVSKCAECHARRTSQARRVRVLCNIRFRIFN